MNAGMCKEAMGMQQKMCDGYDATAQQTYAMTMAGMATNKTMMMKRSWLKFLQPSPVSRVTWCGIQHIRVMPYSDFDRFGKAAAAIACWCSFRRAGATPETGTRRLNLNQPGFPVADQWFPSIRMQSARAANGRFA